jgi:serine/threonine-protein kinase
MSILTPGATFGHYRIVEPIGRGGMASVFKAYEAALDRFVALKVLPPEFLHEPTFGARFEREAKVIAKLEHPNIIPIFAFGIEQGIPWMAMRLIGGGSLSGALKGHEVPRRRAVEIIRAVADALTYAHAQGVVHRDVKPQNILLDEQGRVYLADFGIARIVEGGPSITRTGMVSGTPQYMAPEQATGKGMDHRVDVYALGVVAYELFTGSAPFSADTPVAVLMKQISAEIPIPSPDLVPESMLGPLLKSLAKDPEERWDTPAEFADALQAGMASATTQFDIPTPETILTPRPYATPPPRTGRRPAAPAAGRSAAMMAAVVVALTLLALGTAAVVAWLWLRRGPGEAEGTSPEPTTLATPPVAPSPLGTVAPAPVEAPTPMPPRVTPAARVTTPAPSTTVSSAPTPEPTPTPTPTPGPVASLPAPPPDAHPFRLSAPIDVGAPTVFPVTLRSVRVNLNAASDLELLLDVQCAKSHDQMVTFEVVLFDGAGRAVLTFRGKKGVEEKDKATFKVKQKVPPGLVDSVKAFRVTFTTVDD